MVVEILAFLLLGLIAMLAIVPPIVRGKIEESPLDSTRNFKRSMLEMAASVNPHEYGGTVAFNRRRTYLPSFLMSAGSDYESPQTTPYAAHAAGVKASRRRNRTYLVLGMLTLVTGIIALMAPNAVTIALFAICAVLLLVYALLAFLLVKRNF